MYTSAGQSDPQLATKFEGEGGEGAAMNMKVGGCWEWGGGYNVCTKIPICSLFTNLIVCTGRRSAL